MKQVYENLGKTANEKELKAMVAEVKGPLNFQAMLQLYWDKLSGTDDEPVLAAAFKLFDSNGSGFIKTDALKMKKLFQASQVLKVWQQKSFSDMTSVLICFKAFKTFFATRFS